MRKTQKFKDANLGGTSDLTVIAPIKPGFVPALDAVTYKTRVKRVLKTLHAGRAASHEVDLVRFLSDAVERVGRIHSVRIAVLEPQNAVLLAVTFDGAWESYVRVIWQKVARLLDLIFCNTEDYVNGWESSFEEWGRWLRWRQAETSFLYATPGLTVDDARLLRMQERQTRDTPASDLQVARANLPFVEETAHHLMANGIDTTLPENSLRLDPRFEAQPALFRQGLRSLVGLYRLADWYPPATEDGRVLCRAAHELLPEFMRLLTASDFFGSASVMTHRVAERYGMQFDWLWSGTEEPPAARQFPPLPDGPPIDRLADIQAGILSPYPNCSHGAMLLLACRSREAMAALLDGLQMTSAESQNALKPGEIAFNAALTVEGLRAAGLTDAEVERMPTEFVQGMERRAGLLGDVRDNHPRRWRLPPVNWKDAIDAQEPPESDPIARVQLPAVHLAIHVRLLAEPRKTGEKPIGERDARARLFDALKSVVALHEDIEPLSIQWMSRTLSKDGTGHVEHFGFRDGNSDPVLTKAQAGGFYSNQVHAGEALLGYANAADPSPAPFATTDWLGRLMHNGSFLVVRKLRQDLEVRDGILADASASGIGLSPHELLGRMMGRWPDNHPDEALRGKPLAELAPASKNENDFNFQTDPLGVTCPVHAHIRRANPRTVVPPILKELIATGAREPRIFRRGMSYGPAYDPELQDEEARLASLRAERGLVFMAYNASIGEQFEVVQRWLVGGNSSGGLSGQSDPFVGLPESGLRRTFRFEAPGENVVRIKLDGLAGPLDHPRQLVRLEWGGYFLAPSLPALRMLADRAKSGATAQPVVCWSLEQGERAIAELIELEKRDGAEAAKLAWKVALEDPDEAADFTTASIWAAVRQLHAGVLRTPYGVLMADAAKVAWVLSNPDATLTSTGYLPRMQRSFGPIYLGTDPGQADGR